MNINKPVAGGFKPPAHRVVGHKPRSANPVVISDAPAPKAAVPTGDAPETPRAAKRSGAPAPQAEQK